MSKALFDAIEANDHTSARAALAAGADPRAEHHSCWQIDAGDIPAVVFAALHGDAEMVELLLDAGAHPGETSTKWMCYPFSDDDVPFDRDDAMQVAARLGKGDIVRLVRERGANNLLLPLLEAAKAGNLALVDYLLGEGAGTHGTDGSMFTPLGWAVSNGHDAIAHRLVREGAKFARQHDLDHAVKEARKGGHKALALQAIAWHRAV